MIVMPDADLEAAAKSAVAGMNFTTTAGQSCGSTSRLLLHEAIADEVIKSVVDQVAAIKVGHPLAEGTDMGPVIDQAQYSKSLRAIESGRAAGASVLTGGGRAQGVGSKGWYVAPTVLGDVAPQADVARDEIFGPVLSVLTVRDEAEAVEVANGVDFGLTAAVWTNDLRQAHRMAAGLDAGYVWINGSARHYWGVAVRRPEIVRCWIRRVHGGIAILYTSQSRNRHLGLASCDCRPHSVVVPFGSGERETRYEAQQRGWRRVVVRRADAVDQPRE